MLPITRRGDDNATVISPSDLCVDIIDASQLCGEIADRWFELRSQNPALISPYFDIEFTKAVAQVRNDVEIAIVKSNSNETVGFLPYQRVSRYHAEPVGGRLNDVHGLISNLNAKNHIDMLAKVMAAARLQSFGFHAALKQDPKLTKFEFSEIDSHFIDLRDGWPAYENWSRNQTSVIRRQGQKVRALERQVGQIRFEFDCRDGLSLERLIQLKRSMYQRTRTFDILSVDWASNLLREISGINKPGFQGILSTLSAGDQLVAAHFGMLTDSVLHYWFPVFDPKFARYSPGTELLLCVARTASSKGISKVDFGYGDDPYKFRFCNGRERLSCGKVVSNRLAFQYAKRQYEIRKRLKGIPMKPFAKSVLRSVFPGFGKWNFK